MLSNALQTQQFPINDIKPYAHHAREHNRAQHRKLKRLLGHFGQVVPIIIDHTNTILDGHLVWQVMKDAGHQTITAIRVGDLSEPEIRALRLALNRVAQESRWD
jgi:ParB-like chromosome segregation protein Spo0J